MQKISEQSIYHKIKPILANIHDKFKKPIVFFDLETSGLDINKDEILQIYICKFNGDDFTENVSLFNINCEIRQEAFDKHKISKDDLVNYPYFSEKAQEIYDEYFTDTDSIICGYNSNKFDVPFIIEKFLQSNIIKAVSIVKNPKLDVYKIYKDMYKNTLEDVYERFTGETLLNSHSADTDIMATITILGNLIDNGKEHNFIDTEQMIDAGGFFKLEDSVVKFALGKYKDKSISEIDKNEVLGYLKWINSNSSFCTHTKIIATKISQKLQS